MEEMKNKFSNLHWNPGFRHPEKNKWAVVEIGGEKKILVELTRGYIMIVDPIREVEELLKERTYYALVKGDYVRPFSRDGFFYRHLLLKIHGEIRDDQEVDHIDRRTLNNTVANLRLVSSSGNKRNRGLLKSNSSGYPGISWQERHQRWLVQCTVRGQTIYRTINPRKLGITREAALEVAIQERKKLESEMGYHDF